MKWRSNALWPEGHIITAENDNTTRDIHDTEEQANTICRLLKRDGLNGERCHFPVKTWVEHVTASEMRRQD